MDPANADCFKPFSVFLGHAIDLVLVVATAEQFSKRLERRCQNFDDLVSALFPRLIAFTSFRARILKHDRIGITLALVSGSTPHRSRGDRQYKSDKNSKNSTFVHWSNSFTSYRERP